MVVMCQVSAEYLETYNTNVGGVDVTSIIIFDDTGDVITGNVTYQVIDDGWTIKLHGNLTGNIVGDRLQATSIVNFKYGGQIYPIQMEVDATKVGDHYIGHKVVTFQDRSQSLVFDANKV